MNPINSLDSIAEIIRRRASSDLTTKLSSNSSSSQTESKRQAYVAAKQQTAEVVKLKIVEAIKLIDKNDKNRNKKSMNIFVENVLLWQFGEELINDPAFSQLVNEVGELLSNDTKIMEQLFQIAYSD
jgi:hypothetical protein